MFWIGLVIGLVVGWNIPRPQWMKRLQDWVVAKARDIVGLN